MDIEPVQQSQIFFFISSIGFVILGILLTILIVKCIDVANEFKRILRKIEDNIDNIGDTTKDLIEDMRESTFFRFFLKGHKRKKLK